MWKYREDQLPCYRIGERLKRGRNFEGMGVRCISDGETRRLSNSGIYRGKKSKCIKLLE